MSISEQIRQNSTAYPFVKSKLRITTTRHCISEVWVVDQVCYLHGSCGSLIAREILQVCPGGRIVL